MSDRNQRIRGRGRGGLGDGGRGRGSPSRGASHASSSTASSHSLNQPNHRGARGSYPYFRGRGNNRGTNNATQSERQEYGISYKIIETLCADIDSNKILSGSSDLLKAVQVSQFHSINTVFGPEYEKEVEF